MRALSAVLKLGGTTICGKDDGPARTGVVALRKRAKIRGADFMMNLLTHALGKIMARLALT